MKTILVTGGCGFIGSHTCLALLEKNYELWVIDSFVNSSPKSLKRVKKLVNSYAKLLVLKGDMRDIDFLREVFLKAKAEKTTFYGVIHFAGLKAVEESIFNPLKYWEVNVKGAINLLTVMKENNCKTIVFSSSATIYGVNNNQPIKESSILKSTNPYGSTKIVIENFLNELYLSSPNEWRISSLRYFNPIGAHGSGQIGEDPLGKPQNIFPMILQVAIGRIDKLLVFGNDWPTADGTGIRDYIHVLDLAEAHVLALEFLLREKPQIINLNIGTGIGTSVLELIKKFKHVNNIEIPFEFSNRRKGDCCMIIADNSLATSLLNWSPKRGIEEMCADGWKWQSNNMKGYQ